MSTDHQQYSTDNQLAAIRNYAAEHGVTLVRTYADKGKSGMRVKGRDDFQTMIDAVTSGMADFELIIAYDHSRWGRFQKPYEAAHYAFLCFNAGVEVHFCIGGSSNDMGPLGELAWTFGSMEAGNYSRILSAKVWAGQCRLIRLGYRQGGSPGYGLRRLLLDEKGSPKLELKRGERKSLQTERVVLRPGPPDELRQVKWIYDQFTRYGRSESEIARALNRKGLVTDLGRGWTSGVVRQILTNEKYIGDNVYNRTSGKLASKRRHNAPEDWVRAEGAFAAIVSKEAFLAARFIIEERNRRYSDAEMLDRLAHLLEERGTLSGIIIDEAENMPSSGAYQSRFGSLIRAYELIGFKPDRDFRYVEINRMLRALHQRTVAEVIDGLCTQGGNLSRDARTDLLTVNGEFTTSIVIARCRETPSGRRRWKIRFDSSLAPDITIAVRMNRTNESPVDYYVFPRTEMTSHRLGLSEENGFMLDAYRHDSLSGFLALAGRSRISELAPW